MKYVIDIDGTICFPGEGDAVYTNARPRTDRISRINQLYIEGHEITYFTARGMGRHNNDREKAYEEFYDFTLKQLCGWGCMFNHLYLGKPSGDIYIDDKGVSDVGFFS